MSFKISSLNEEAIAENALGSKVKLCPMSFRTCKPECAWWHAESEGCAILVIANQLFQGIIQTQETPRAEES